MVLSASVFFMDELARVSIPAESVREKPAQDHLVHRLELVLALRGRASNLQ